MKSNLLAPLLLGFALEPVFGLAGCGKSTSSPADKESDAVSAAKVQENSKSASATKTRDASKNALEAKAPDRSDYVAAAKAQSINNLKQIVLAFHNYASASTNSITLPSAGLPESIKSTEDNPYLISKMRSWRFEILPYIEQNSLYNQMFQSKERRIPDKLAKTEIATYQNPLDPKKQPYMTNYRVFVGNGAAFEYGKQLTFKDFTDGLPNTVIVVEAADPVDWSKIDELAYDPKKPLPKLGIFQGGFHAGMADGAIRWIPADTDEKLIRAMITRNGGEKITLPGRAF